MSKFLVSLAEAKEYLVLSGTSGFDSILTSLLGRTKRNIERFCNRRFLAEQYTEFYSGKGSTIDEEHVKIFVKNPPIVAVTSLHDDIDRNFTSTTLIATGSFTIDGNEDIGVIELIDEVFEKGVKNIKVIYTGGFTDGAFFATGGNAFAEDIQHANLLWIGREWRRHEQRLHGTTSITRQESTENVEIGAMPDEIREILENYRFIQV
jgi:hypothetical protein